MLTVSDGFRGMWHQTRNGRISMAGVNSGNVERLAAAIHEVTKDAK